MLVLQVIYIGAPNYYGDFCCIKVFVALINGKKYVTFFS